MLGLLVIIVVSGLLMHFIEKKNIEVIGVIPNGHWIVQFLIGVIFIILITIFTIFSEGVILKVDWDLQTSINFKSIFDSFMYHLRSALTEDLVFRGAILYILISKLGARWAILTSAMFFGIYHVFSYGMTGNGMVSILFVVITTGFTGYVWAYVFYKTKSIALGLGFHLGYNFVMSLFYPLQPFGELIFTEVSRTNLADWGGLFFSLFKGLFPSIVTYAFVKHLLKANLKFFQNNEYERTSQ